MLAVEEEEKREDVDMEEEDDVEEDLAFKHSRFEDLQPVSQLEAYPNFLLKYPRILLASITSPFSLRCTPSLSR